MIDLSVNGLEKSYGFKKILNGFSLELRNGERLALIGPNGSGKTTIFKIITGEENVQTGTVSIRKGASVGILSQIPPTYDDNMTVKDVLLMSKKKVFEIERKMHECETKMSTSTDSEKLAQLLKIYGQLQETYEEIGGYTVETELNKVCNGFKISPEMQQRKFNTLSGGEKTIVHFASLILRNPSILLLDEPTNHLDIDTLEWLEEYLKNYNGSILISSHDRYFLDRVVTKTVLIDRGKDEVFLGNYSYYLEENERRIMNEFEEFKDQQKQIAAMKASIKKLQEFGHLASPGGEAFFKRAASIQKRLDKLELLDKPESKKDLPLNFEVEKRSGKDVLKLDNLSLMIGDRILLEDANMHIVYGQKVCLMGKNGTGKSTIIKLLFNDTPAQIVDGEIKLGSSIRIGYLPQEIKFEDEKATVLDTARRFFDGTETALRATLAKFLFYDEQVYKRVGKLSGGEKVRLKLLELIQMKANFLILDEPTNHIDIDTKEMLEEALKEYKGTILFISHDRYFINKLAEKIFTIEDCSITESIGNYEDYKRQKERQKEVKEQNRTRKK